MVNFFLGVVVGLFAGIYVAVTFPQILHAWLAGLPFGSVL